MSNITGLPPPEPNAMRAALESMKRNRGEWLEFIKLTAEMDFARVEALKAAGFNAADAIKILCAEKIRATVG